ncbi:MAG: hypothetical protein MZV65_15520 [Chromatiales bacterium]|nr:hypothetical protein [Chromatiales bacterium]
MIEMALQGRGIACVLYYQVMDHIAAGRLHLLLQEFRARPASHPRGLRASQAGLGQGACIRGPFEAWLR